MLGHTSRRLGALFFATGLGGVAIASACAEKKGALMLAINTDMKAPKDVNAVSVTISTNGAIKHSFIGRVTPQGEVLLPATLAIVQPDDDSASIRIRVMAFQDRKPRVLRDIRTTVPTDGRTALLRIPLNFVNDGSATGTSLPSGIVPEPFIGTETPAGGSSGSSGGTSSGDPGGVGGGAADFDFFGAFQPPCPDIQNQTIIDGECKDNFVDPGSLPDFDTAQLGDSTDVGSCFDVARCFGAATVAGSGGGEVALDAGSDASRVPAPPPDASAGGDAGGNFKDYRPAAVTLDTNACSLQLNGANPERLNIALVTRDVGECVRPGECYVPIDHGGDGGWKAENGRVQLPTFVCRLIGAKQLRLVTSTETCAAKEESSPICTPQKPSVVTVDSGPDPLPIPALDGVYFTACLTRLAAGRVDRVFRFYTEVQFVPTKGPGGGLSGSIELSMTPLRLGPVQGPPTMVSREQTVGTTVKMVATTNSAGVYGSGTFGTLNIPAEANPISGRLIVIENAASPGRFGAGKFCSQLSGEVVEPTIITFIGNENTCIHFPVKSGDPLPALAPDRSDFANGCPLQ